MLKSANPLSFSLIMSCNYLSIWKMNMSMGSYLSHGSNSIYLPPSSIPCFQILNNNVDKKKFLIIIIFLHNSSKVAEHIHLYLLILYVRESCTLLGLFTYIIHMICHLHIIIIVYSVGPNSQLQSGEQLTKQQ